MQVLLFLHDSSHLLDHHIYLVSRLHIQLEGQTIATSLGVFFSSSLSPSYRNLTFWGFDI